MNNIYSRMARGVAWMTLMRFVVRGIGTLSTLILARLLTPGDFGLLAMATAIIAAIELLTAFGFETALIQNRDASRHEYDTAWTLNVILGGFLGLLLAIIAKPAAAFYGEPRLPGVMYWLACSVVVQGFGNISTVQFLKELDYRRDFLVQVLRKAAGFIVTIPLAFWLRNYWALVAGMMGGGLAGVIISYALKPYRPRFCLEGFHALFHFSKWLVFNNMINYFRNRSADLVLAKTAGAGGLGIFAVAYQIATLPTTELTAPINRAVFPGYAKLAHDRSLLRVGYLNVLALIALLSLPAAAGIAAIAPLMVPLLLGQQWVAAIPLIRLIALHGGILSLMTNTGSVYNSLGKPSYVTLIGAIQIAVLLPAMLLLTRAFGVNGAAYAYIGSTVFIIPIIFRSLIRLLEMSISSLVACIWRPVLAALVLYAGISRYVLFDPVLSWIDNFLHMLAACAIGALLYTTLVSLLWVLSGRPPGAEGHVFGWLRRRYDTWVASQPTR